MLNKKIKKTKFLDKKYEFNIAKLMKNSESYKSLIYGVVTVLVLFAVIVLGMKSLSQNKAQIDNNAAVVKNAVESLNDNRYTVVEGDTLWSIAQKSYNDGFSWNEIAKANNITDPQSLEKGMKLVIPSLAPTPATVAKSDTVGKTIAVLTATTEQTQGSDQKITGNTYTVVHGDYLWEIAVRAYGDGFRWVDIAKANNLSNPNVIHAGNVFNLPRP